MNLAATRPTRMPTEAELREHYARTGLEEAGITYDYAMTRASTRLALINTVLADRRRRARQAQAAALPHQTQEAP